MQAAGTPDTETATPSKRSLARRLAPIAIILALMALVFTTGLHKYLSLAAGPSSQSQQSGSTVGAGPRERVSICATG